VAATAMVSKSSNKYKTVFLFMSFNP
jgi:hypothetical protein